MFAADDVMSENLHMDREATRPVWRYISDDEQQEVQRLVAFARRQLVSAGYRFEGYRFPFAMHHAYYREKVRIAGRKAKHSDISSLLMAWAGEGDFPSRYAWQAICGSLLHANKGALPELPEGVSEGIRKVDGGKAFDEWLEKRSV